MICRFLSNDIFRFLTVGGCSTLIDFLVYMVLSMHLPIMIAKSVSMGSVSIVSYFLNKSWTFKRGKKGKANYLIKYYGTYAINVSINLGINYFVYLWTGYKILSFVMATVFAMVINFLLQKFFVFRS